MTGQSRDLNDWLMEQKCRSLVHALEHRRFTAVYCPTVRDAADAVIAAAESAATVGFGGSLSVAELDVQPRLAEMGKELLDHGRPGLTPEEKMTIMRRQLTCDLFLTGTNAVTQDGCLVNIDGNGNRVASMIFGPKKVVIVVGRNKIVDGDINDAYLRIKQKASPPNAKRLNKKTPCAETGFCADCDSPDRICMVTTLLERKPRLTDVCVLVVNADLGL
ncbi:MAG: lactate utilization protein [Kiritimatiellae bacterium]|nr:lactate utilization protein [Kiritimatiellia bacterium]MBP5226426.1 lactate utilization protein [Kiritimatiellia bacterium]